MEGLGLQGTEKSNFGVKTVLSVASLRAKVDFIHSRQYLQKLTRR